MNTTNLRNNCIEIHPDDLQIISLNKFVILSILSVGLYEVWWMYKAWRFYQYKDDLDIRPLLRSLFNIFFAYSLFCKILKFAKEKGYKGYYPSILLFIGFFVSNLLAKLFDPWWMLSFLSIAFLIPPFKALNFAKQHSTELEIHEQTSFNKRQVYIIVLGTIWWGFVLLSIITSSMSYT